MDYTPFESLFVRSPDYAESEKTAAITLSRDGADWERQISDALHSEHPFIQEHDIAMHLTRTDAETGVGVGSIRIDNKVLVPIIIDKFKLAPLDLFWFEDALHPLTRDALESALQDATIGNPVTPGQGETTDVSLYGRTQPPFDGKYTYAELLKAAAVTHREVGQSLAKAFGSNSKARAAIVNSDPVQQVLRALRNGETARVKLAARECAAAKPKLVVRAAARKLEKVAGPGLWRVVDDGGRERQAFIIDHVLDSHAELQAGRRLVLGLDKAAGYAFLARDRELAGRREIEIAKLAAVDFSATTPSSRTTGFFVKFAHKGAIAAGPFRIEYGVDGGWAARDGLNQPVRLAKEAALAAPAAYDRTLIFPADWAWVEVGASRNYLDLGAAELVSRPNLTKVAFTLRRAGARLAVLGFEPETFPAEGEAAAATAAKLYQRFDAESVRGLLDKVAACGEAEALLVDSPAPCVEAPCNMPAPRQLLQEACYIRSCGAYSFPTPTGPIKIAAVTDQEASRTVDALLGLNFLNPENLYRFAEKLDLIREAREASAKLLLASRLGLAVDSRPLRTAMFALDAVERDLRELQNSIEIPEVRG